jgi:hypothetical protein
VICRKPTFRRAILPPSSGWSEDGSRMALWNVDTCPATSLHGVPTQKTTWIIDGFSFPSRNREEIFLSSPSPPRTPSLCPVAIEGFFSGGKAVGAAHHLPPSSVEIKNAWRYTSSPAYVFMTWYLVTHRGVFTFCHIEIVCEDAEWIQLA